ncbi:hypothetical protein MTsPCn5_07040 [Croceitalea sp. MTPC5]|uniref:hypothetical protein n=1 Tax=Croceitalea sp. MTPC5 TaxID=3056565 RepID=UPI002B3B24BC|nr:hypothetical protein MTsPCn5_07040 [Croceitalea sp. MTPC5]
MRRVIIDYKKLDHSLAAQLIDLYPHGYGDEDIIVLKKANGELIEAVEIKTHDTIYLVKISKSLSNFIANFEENIEKQFDKAPKESHLESENLGLEFSDE